MNTGMVKPVYISFRTKVGCFKSGYLSCSIKSGLALLLDELTGLVCFFLTCLVAGFFGIYSLTIYLNKLLYISNTKMETIAKSYDIT